MKKFSILFISFLAFQLSQAQERVITTGVPFLLVAADARSAGLADQGVATSPDEFSQQYNPAKFAFSTSKQGVSVSYTPYLTDLVNDISLGQLTYHNRFMERSAFAASLRYFSLGEIELRQNFDDPANVVKPNELAFDLSYSLQLNPRFSMAVAGRYIRSSLKVPSDPGQDTRPANSFAVDIAGFYKSEEVAYSSFNGKYRLGFNFQNMGPKIKYDIAQGDDNANFLPANMRIGGAFDFIFDEYNKVTASVEFTKLLVPTPQEPTFVDTDADGEISAAEEADARAVNNATYRKINWVSGIFQSFGDAPDGFSEELKEFTYSVGAEYYYQDSFAFRLGYFNESELKGARKFFSLGAGFKYNIVKIDVSYLFSASKVKNPLENTLRFSLSFNFGENYEDY